MDRCALFVDAGYALADGAMAVHGTRRRDSVTWDHAGLLKLLAGLARDRTGLPVLRCYWYETAAEGRRTSEHDALAEMPGLKLRLVNALPGRREGIESQLRRDLVTLAKSGAISDAFIASANEHIAEIVAEVQDLGLRVVVLHIASDSGWTIPLPLRQECDDIVEISGVHLRPFVDLIRGAEPAAAEDQVSQGPYGGHALDAKSAVVGAVTHQGQPAAALPAPGVVYPIPDGSEYRQDLANFGGQGLSQQGLSQQGLGQHGRDTGPGQPSGPIGAGPSQKPADLANGYHSPAAQAPGNQAGNQASNQAAPPPVPSQGGTGEYQVGGHGGYSAGANGYQNGSGAYQPGLNLNGSAQNGSSQNGSSQRSASPHSSAVNGSGSNAESQNGLGQNGLGQNGLSQFGYQVSHPGQGSGPTGYPAEIPDRSGVNGSHGTYHGNHQSTSPGEPPTYQNGQNGHGPHSSTAGQNGSGSVNDQPSQLPTGTNGALPGPGPNGPGHHAPGHNGVPQQGQSFGVQPLSSQPLSSQPLNSQPLNSQPPNAQPLGSQPLGAPVHAGYQPGPGHAGSPQQGSQSPGAPPQSSSPAPPPPTGSPHAGSQHGAAPHADPRAGDPYGQALQPSMAVGFEPAPTPLPVQHGFGMPEGGFAPGQLPPGMPGPSGMPGPGQVPAQPGPPGGPDQSQRAAFGQPPGLGPQPHYQLPHAAPAPQPGTAVAQMQPRPQPVAIALPDAVKAAHAEGFTFGESVGRDAPGLWLEAVLARKPRMPSDLEARLLQGSVLPIDSLLHDEVRHSLRRGFWDALESARR